MNDSAHSATRRLLSSSEMSSTRVITDQRTPNGSRMLAKRSPDALDLFNAGLSEAGYVARPEYDAEQWVPAGARSYEILDGFPRLVASALPPGVLHVRYDISPAECVAFERPADWIGAFVCP